MKIIHTFVAMMLMLIPVISISDVGGGDRSFEDGLFWSTDLDRNERLDRDEAKTVYNLAEDEIFTRYDEDGNGLINRPEFMEFIQQSPWTDKFFHPKDKE